MRKAIIGVCGLLAWGTLAYAAEPAREIDIRPVQHQAWGNSTASVKAILLSAARELERHFPERRWQPILVEPLGGPITLFERGPGGEYRVQLDTGDNLWAQWIYQFAHEFGHILSQYDEVRHGNKWFEETICEVASLYVLLRLAETWSQEPAPAAWKRFAPSLRKYAQNRLEKSQLPEAQPFPDWYAAHARELSRTGYDREKNTIAATALLPLFQESPEQWAAIAFLAKAKKGHGETFPEYLKAWQQHSPEKHRAFIGKVGRRFGIDLTQVKLGPAKE